MPFQFGNLFQRRFINGSTDIFIPALIGDNCRTEQFGSRSRRMVTEGDCFYQSFTFEYVKETAQKFTDIDLFPMKLKYFHEKNKKRNDTAYQNNPHDRTAVPDQTK